MSISAYQQAAFLNSLPSTMYVKLHLSNPGENGLNGAATETTRQSLTLGTYSAGARASSNSQEWNSYPASETITHISLWDNVSAGNCIWYMPLTNPIGVGSGGTLQFGTGSLVVRID